MGEVTMLVVIEIVILVWLQMVRKQCHYLLNNILLPVFHYESTLAFEQLSMHHNHIFSSLFAKFPDGNWLLPAGTATWTAPSGKHICQLSLWLQLTSTHLL